VRAVAEPLSVSAVQRLTRSSSSFRSPNTRFEGEDLIAANTEPAKIAQVVKTLRLAGSGQRSAIRGDLSPGRRVRPLLDADCPADSRAGCLSRASRPGLRGIRAQQPHDSAGTDRVRPDRPGRRRRSHQDMPAASHQSNQSSKRQLTATWFAELVLGSAREDQQLRIQTLDRLVARSVYIRSGIATRCLMVHRPDPVPRT